MAADEIYFFDTYALIEIIKGSQNYLSYVTSKILLTKLNLFELYYCLLREADEKAANLWLSKLRKFVIDFDESVIGAAAKLRLANKAKRLSMTDCIGYVSAIKYGVKFLTGDREFEGRANVEFVK